MGVIDAQCACGEVQQFDSAFAGRVAKCPKLDEHFKVPDESGPVSFLVEVSDDVKVVTPITMIKAIVRKSSDALQRRREAKRERKSQLFRAREAERLASVPEGPTCIHCHNEINPHVFSCRVCGCPIQDEAAQFVFLENRRKEAHEKEIAEKRLERTKEVSNRNVSQSVVIKNESFSSGCLSVIAVIVLIFAILVCAGWFTQTSNQGVAVNSHRAFQLTFPRLGAGLRRLFGCSTRASY